MKNNLHAVCFAGALVALAAIGSAQQIGESSNAARIAAGRALTEAGCVRHTCGGSLGAQFDHADLVFEGIVRRIESRLSDPSADGKAPRLPVTFVTLDIIEVFWGVAPQRTAGRITIRILGGPTPDGRIVNVSGRPLFDVGQRDILMVRRNHRGVASVLHGSNRRFRLRGKDVFLESGRELLASPEGELLPGSLHDIPEFRRVRIGGQVLEQVVSDAANEQPAAAASGGHVRLLAADFRLLLREMARRASPAKFQSTQLVGDVSKADRFVLTRSVRRQARDVKGPPMSEDERKEREAEKANR